MSTVSDNASDRFTGFLMIPGALSLLVATMVASRQGFGKHASMALLVGGALLFVGALSDDNISEVRACGPAGGRPLRPGVRAQKAGLSIGSTMPGLAVGLVAGLVCGPVQFVGLSALVAGAAAFIPAPIAVYRDSGANALGTAFLNTKHFMLFFAVVFASFGCGVGLAAFIRKMRSDVDAAMFSLSATVRRWLPVAVLVVCSVLMIVVLSLEDKTNDGKWMFFLTVIFVVPASFAFAAAQEEGRSDIVLALSNGCLCMSSALTALAAVPAGTDAGVNLYLLVVQGTSSVVAMALWFFWDSQVKERDTAVVRNGIDRLRAMPRLHQAIIIFLALGFTVTVACLCSAFYHNTLFIGTVALGVGAALMFNYEGNSNTHITLLVVTHCVAGHVGLWGLANIGDDADKNDTTRTAFAVGLFGYFAAGGALINSCKLFFPRLNCMHNRFTIILDDSGEEGAGDVPSHSRMDDVEGGAQPGYAPSGSYSGSEFPSGGAQVAESAAGTHALGGDEDAPAASL